MVANQGARRLRACILGVIPGDVVDTAVKQCEMTQANSGGAPEEQVKSLVSAFAEVGVQRDQIEKYLGHRITSVVGAEVVRLRKVFTSIRDGMAAPGDFFDVKPTSVSVKDLKQSQHEEHAEFPREAQNDQAADGGAEVEFES
jgi:hypothetical protein